MCEKGHVASRPIRHAMSGRSVRCPRLFPGNTEAGRGGRGKNPRGGNTEYGQGQYCDHGRQRESHEMPINASSLVDH